MAPELDSFKLTTSIMTTVDLNRVERELEALNNFTMQSSVRSAGKQPNLPKTSRNLDEIASANNCNLLVEADRQKLTQFIAQVKKSAPVINISFASDPQPPFLAKIVSWFRAKIHPLTLLQVGLQPSIAAGCIVRTQNKYFDFSLRASFDKKKDLLINSLSGVPDGSSRQ